MSPRFPAPAAILGTALLVAGCASAPTSSGRYVMPPAGSTAEYRVTSTGSFGNGTTTWPVRAEQGTFDGRTVQNYVAPPGTTVRDPQGGVVAILDTTGRAVMQYSPPLGAQWPLEVGKRWATEHTLTAPNGQKLPMRTSWAVEGIEEVTVPAGTFKAYRIRWTDNFGYVQTIWTVPEMGYYLKRESVRPENHPQKPGTMVEELVKASTMR